MPGTKTPNDPEVILIGRLTRQINKFREAHGEDAARRVVQYAIDKYVGQTETQGQTATA